MIKNIANGEIDNKNIILPISTDNQIIDTLSCCLQQMLDDTAHSRYYDNIFTAVSYAGDIDPIFNAEGTAFKNWRSNCWKKAYEIMTDVKLGNRLIPTVEQFMAEMPQLIFPHEIAMLNAAQDGVTIEEEQTYNVFGRIWIAIKNSFGY